MRRPFRVMQVLEATRDGTRRHLNEVLSALGPEEFEVHIVCAVWRDPSFQDDIAAYRRAGLKVSIVPMTRGLHPAYDVQALFELRRLLRRWPCDLLHLHSAKAGCLGRLAARGLGPKVVYSPHAFPFLQRVAFPLRWTYAALERALARHTDFLLAVSVAEGRLAAEMGLYRPTRVHVLPNALNVEQLDRQVGPLMEVPEPGVGRTFAFLGELRKQKDPDTFLQAALLLRERGVAARFVMPARGHDLERIQAYLDRHHLRSIVELIPAESSLTALHLKGHVGVLPSRWEGLPYTVLEALALRHPVVASGLPVFEDLLRPLDQRLLFPAGDSRALAERLELWAGMPSRELAEVGERARTLVVEEYDFCSWQKGLRRIYRAILGPRKDGETRGVVEP